MKPGIRIIMITIAMMIVRIMIIAYTDTNNYAMKNTNFKLKKE